jgi:hypothetical protein
MLFPLYILPNKFGSKYLLGSPFRDDPGFAVVWDVAPPQPQVY